jgi:hypothetical protein
VKSFTRKTNNDDIYKYIDLSICAKNMYICLQV